MICLKCNRQWDSPSEQAVSIDLFGECIVCRKDEMTKEEFDLIGSRAKAGTLAGAPERPQIEPMSAQEMTAAVDKLWADAENSVEFWQEKARLACVDISRRQKENERLRSELAEAQKNECNMCINTARGPARIDAGGFLILDDGSGIGVCEAELYLEGLEHGLSRQQAENKALRETLIRAGESYEALREAAIVVLMVAPRLTGLMSFDEALYRLRQLIEASK
jgi:hypothetical protein